MTAGARVLVVGFDSADRAVVSRLCAQGELPTLEGLRARGARGILRSPTALGDDATWASFATACSPGRHGRYFWQGLRPGTYAHRLFDSSEFGREAFWAVLSRAGHRVAVIDVPKSPIAIEINGLQLADWLTHGRDGATRSVPSSVAVDVLARFGDDPTDRPGTPAWLCRMDPLSPGELELLLEQLLDTIERKAALSADYLGQGGWDLFLTVFKESHCVGHQCWHLLDPGSPAHDPALAHRLRGPIRRVYRALDRALARLIALVGPDSFVIVFSGLGMSVNNTGDHLLDEVLRRRERAATSRARRAALAVERALERFGGRWASTSAGRDRRQAFQVEHNEISGAIRVNVKGREPRGMVERGEELDAFCAALTRDLLDLVDPDSGRPIVERVIRTDDAYPGELRERLPDLLVVWRRDHVITGATSAKIGRLQMRPPPLRTGNHVPDGWFACAGPTVPPGLDIEPASIMDLGPTIAALLGATLPESDGRPIGALSRPATGPSA